MFQTQYAVHPPYFAHYDYRSPPHTPPQPTAYYSPRQYVYTSTPPRAHTRRATGDSTYAYTKAAYSNPRKSSYYSGAEYSSPGHYTSAAATPQRKSEYVSGTDRDRDRDRDREHTRTYRVKVEVGGDGRKRSSSSKQYKQHSSSYTHAQAQYVYDVSSDEYLPRYEQYEPRPPPYQRRPMYDDRDGARADHRYRAQVPIYTAADPGPHTSSRPRRASYAAYTPRPSTSSQHHQPRRPTAAKPPPKATEDDVRRAGIPAGYSYKNWDPTEEPILLLGSVFDANSLGKWIYDWTVFYYGPATPMSEVAGELWLLLIQLAGKIKRAEECMPRIRRTASRDLVEEFLEAGERLWQRFNKLLKICESYMWKAARKEKGASSSSTAKVTMGQNSGCEFVDSIFGRDRELERTEKLMTGMRLWSMRFDGNCEEIIRNPAA